METETKVNRLARELDTREKSQRPQKRWTPPQLLPEPNPEPGYEFHWVRVSTQGNADATNISAKLREGYEPVKASEHPEIVLYGANPNARFPDSIEIGGLLLCKIPAEFHAQRNDYYTQQHNSQMQSVDNNFMRENDPRMPLFNERRTKVTFGKGV
jgi:hypothetical protein